MIKKISIFFFLLTCFSFIKPQDHFYAFIMHATHEENYDHVAWQKGSDLIESLVNYYEENKSNLDADIDKAITTIKDICVLYNNKLGLHIEVRIARNPYKFPFQGLFISIDSLMEDTSLENYNRIDALLKNFETCNNEKDILPILEIIKPVISLTNGNICQNVRNFECCKMQ